MVISQGEIELHIIVCEQVLDESRVRIIVFDQSEGDVLKGWIVRHDDVK